MAFTCSPDQAHVLYKATDFYRPECERTLAWNDPDLTIDWQLEDDPICPLKTNGGCCSETCRSLNSPSSGHVIQDTNSIPPNLCKHYFCDKEHKTLANTAALFADLNGQPLDIEHKAIFLQPECRQVARTTPAEPKAQWRSLRSRL